LTKIEDRVLPVGVLTRQLRTAYHQWARERGQFAWWMWGVFEVRVYEWRSCGPKLSSKKSGPLIAKMTSTSRTFSWGVTEPKSACRTAA